MKKFYVKAWRFLLSVKILYFLKQNFGLFYYRRNVHEISKRHTGE